MLTKSQNINANILLVQTVIILSHQNGSSNIYYSHALCNAIVLLLFTVKKVGYKMVFPVAY